MKPNTAEWVEKAEGDLVAARREGRARKAPNHDAACFHAQQCAEKYLKAFLVEKARPCPKIHDLVALQNAAGFTTGEWAMLQPDLHWLSSLAVEVRYPGESAGRPETKRAIAITERVRSLARRELKIPR